MSLTKEILRITARYHPIGYVQLFEYIYEETIYGKKFNKRSVHAIINRLENKGFISRKNNRWSVSPKAKKFLEKKGNQLKIFFEKEVVWKNQEKPKKLIVVFDIPEKRKKYRDWLRMELVGFGFTMIQKSVWLGPGLPREFLEYLNEAGLLKHIRFFQAAEKDLI